MFGHRCINAPDLPPALTEPRREFRFFARHQCAVEAADLLKSVDPHHCIAATREGQANLSVPFLVGKAVVQGSVGMGLSPSSASDGCLRVRGKEFESPFDPALEKQAVTVHELDIAALGEVLP